MNANFATEILGFRIRHAIKKIEVKHLEGHDVKLRAQLKQK